MDISPVTMSWATHFVPGVHESFKHDTRAKPTILVNGTLGTITLVLANLNGRMLLGWPLYLEDGSDIFRLQLPLTRRTLRKLVITNPFDGDEQTST